MMSALQEELIALQPQLEDSTRQTEAAMEVIARETVEADKVKKVGSYQDRQLMPGAMLDSLVAVAAL
jgi:dynein heavy chain